MSERSVQAFDAQHKAAHQFDYFVCGVAGAIFAYIVKDYSPHKLAFDLSILTPAALVCLAGSFFAGLKRIESTIAAMRFNAAQLNLSEKAGHLTEVIMKSGWPSEFYDKQTGEVGTTEQLPSRRDAFREGSKKAKTHVERNAEKAKTYYNLRNRLLILGFIAILAAKVAQPYSTRPAVGKTNVPVNTVPP